MEIEHPDINRIERLGAPNIEYLEWELRLEREEIVEDEWPDGLTHAEWQKERGVEHGEMERTAYRSL